MATENSFPEKTVNALSDQRAIVCESVDYQEGSTSWICVMLATSLNLMAVESIIFRHRPPCLSPK